MNIENFKKARQWVADSRRFDMQEYIDHPALSGEEIIEAGFPCGTVACLAGEISIQTGRLLSNAWYESIAREFLEITHDQGGKLFRNELNYYDVGTDFLATRRSGYGLQFVTKPLVLAKLDAIIEAGEWVD